jgi:hypothetical protein
LSNFNISVAKETADVDEMTFFFLDGIQVFESQLRQNTAIVFVLELFKL